uniref:Uncharacterized protein n=1 Tax=Sphaeramia orbicularis TaxID=375764 RepID=A0A672Z0Z4_9TELE
KSFWSFWISGFWALVLDPLDQLVLGPILEPLDQLVLGLVLEPLDQLVLGPILEPLDQLVLGPILEPLDQLVLGPILEPLDQLVLGPILEPLDQLVLGPSFGAFGSAGSGLYQCNRVCRASPTPTGLSLYEVPGLGSAGPLHNTQSTGTKGIQATG